jgi:2-polyprenyl-6-methoxyphenol hydroxylase-like FAD-dependent oxidoreductase
MIGAHAVVLGASMAGLLAARVLADFYESVTVVERDELPDTAANRRGCRRVATPMPYSAAGP